MAYTTVSKADTRQRERVEPLGRTERRALENDRLREVARVIAAAAATTPESATK